MNLSALKKALAPELHKHEINGMYVYIHRPTVRDAEFCTTVPNVIELCVKDENGNKLFSQDGKDNDLIDIRDLDNITLNGLYMAVLALLSVDDQDEVVEKK